MDRAIREAMRRLWRCICVFSRRFEGSGARNGCGQDATASPSQQVRPLKPGQLW